MKKLTEDPLFALEWSSSRLFLPFSVRNAAVWAAFLAIVVIGVGLFLPDDITPESLFACGAAMIAIIGFSIGLGSALTQRENPWKDWWLTMPHSREALVRAKLFAMILTVGSFAAGIWLACVLIAAVRAQSGVYWTDPGTAGRLPGDMLSYALAYAAEAPICASLGLSLLGMYSGYRRWLLLPLAALFLPLYGMISAVLSPNAAVQRAVSAEAFFYGACAALLVAAPLCKGVVRFVAGYGMPELARHRSNGLPTRKRKETVSQARFKANGTGFRALFGFERSRYRHFSLSSPARVLYVMLVFAAAAGGCFAVAQPQGILNLIMGLTMATAWAPSIVLSLVTQTDANRRRLVWWIALPFRRRTLLLARWTAVWATVLKGAAGLLAAMIAGAAVRWGIGGSVPVLWNRDGHTALYIAVSLLAMGLLLSGITLAYPAAYRNAWTAWLILPVTSGAAIAPIFASRWLVTERVLAGEVGPEQWRMAALVAAAALALGGAGLALGAKWLHLYLTNTQDAAQRLRGAGRSRGRPLV